MTPGERKNFIKTEWGEGKAHAEDVAGVCKSGKVEKCKSGELRILNLKSKIIYDVRCTI
jgi:hypothetical protein